MSITARLSHNLHRALGDDAASDLVDWMQQIDRNPIELREWNELNFSRMDGHEQVMDARFAAGRSLPDTARWRFTNRIHWTAADSALDSITP